jgi:hypothetical protein
MSQETWTEKRFSLGITLILGIFTTALLIAFVYQLTTGPVGSKPAPTWFLAGMTGLFLLLTVNFACIKTTLSSAGVRVRYGIFSCFRSWEQLEGCEEDTQKRLLLGWGIRMIRYQGRSTWVFNTVTGRKVVFRSKSTGPWHLIVSTGDPDTMLAKAAAFMAAGR